jgi:hypothetical protein
MDDGIGEMRHMMQQLMLYGGGNGVPLRHRQLRTHREVELGMEPMPYPPDPDLGDLLHLWYVPNRLHDVCKHSGLYSV